MSVEKKDTGSKVFGFGVWSGLVWWVASGVGHADPASALLGMVGFVAVFGFIGGGIGLYSMGKARGEKVKDEEEQK